MNAPNPSTPAGSGWNGGASGWNGGASGKALLRASWTLLKQDRSMLWLPVISSVSAIVAAFILFVPGFLVGHAVDPQGGFKVGAYVGVVLGGFAASVVGIYFQAALVIGANQRAEGGDPTVGSALAAAWERKGPILAWALLTTTVGLAIRAIERRLGAVGWIAGLLGGIAWAIATFLAVPVVVAEGVGPIAAVKRSAGLIRQTWGLGLRSTLRFGIIQFVFLLPGIVLFVVGIATIGSRNSAGISALGIALLAVAVVWLIAVGIVFGAIATYARAMLYRYATGRPVPGLDPAMMAGAFVPRGRGRNAFGI